jgi:hypothetical protein
MFGRTKVIQIASGVAVKAKEIADIIRKIVFEHSSIHATRYKRS